MDIVIPIYNALDDLKKCMISVVEHTDLSKNHVWLIDDQSPDPHVWEYVLTLEAPGVSVFRNEVNLGFSGTVNRGISMTDRDVILLNTDTVVTNGWVNKLYSCLYQDEMNGTATPLCNNATICSVPVYYENNRVPKGFTVDSFADFIEQVSLRSYPEIPVAVGFCMAIKRRLIAEVGLFDAETFGRGYGEENDFCFRAQQLGYRNVLCDDTFILHTGSASFGDEKRSELAQAHEKILLERYPSQMEKAAQFCITNPIHYIQENIQIRLKMVNGRKNLLFLAQRDFREDAMDHVGGVQFHVKDMVENLRHLYNVFVLARDGEYLRLTAYLVGEEVSMKFWIGAPPAYPVEFDSLQKSVYANVLDSFHIDIVHIQNVFELSLDLFYEAKKRKLPLLFTIHDYYLLCPGLWMIDADEKQCIDRQTEEKCKQCLFVRKGFTKCVNYIPVWRRRNLRALELCDAIIAPSDCAKRFTVQIYPTLENRISVIPHGINICPEKNLLTANRTKAVNVAFVGGISIIKGSKTVIEMVKMGPTWIHWFMLGGTGEKELMFLAKPNLWKSDWYDRQKLPTLLAEKQIDVVCILSICAETFCYTLSEVTACGIPCIARDLGAVGERVRQMKIGWLVPEDATAQDVLKVIEHLHQHPDELEAMREKARQYHTRTCAEMATDYNRLFEEYPTGNYTSEQQAADPKAIYQALFYMGEVTSVWDSREGDACRRLALAEEHIRKTENSRSFKAMLLIKTRLQPYRVAVMKMISIVFSVFRIKVK